MFTVTFVCQNDSSDTIARHARFSPLPASHTQLVFLQCISSLTIFFFKHIFDDIYLFICVFGMGASVQRLWLVARGHAGSWFSLSTLGRMSASVLPKPPHPPQTDTSEDQRRRNSRRFQMQVQILSVCIQCYYLYFLV